MGLRVYFGSITLNQKGEDDWRAFVRCSKGNEWWELRAYGFTAEMAARQAYERFLDDADWDCYGYTVDPDDEIGCDEDPPTAKPSLYKKTGEFLIWAPIAAAILLPEVYTKASWFIATMVVCVLLGIFLSEFKEK